MSDFLVGTAYPPVIKIGSTSVKEIRRGQTLHWPRPVDIPQIIIYMFAGGGSGGNGYEGSPYLPICGGGGGAGGLKILYYNVDAFKPITTVTIGSGGIAPTQQGMHGQNGGDTTMDFTHMTVIAHGGGGGGGADGLYGKGRDGGCGGGGGGYGSAHGIGSDTTDYYNDTDGGGGVYGGDPLNINVYHGAGGGIRRHVNENDPSTYNEDVFRAAYEYGGVSSEDVNYFGSGYYNGTLYNLQQASSGGCGGTSDINRYKQYLSCAAGGNGSRSGATNVNLACGGGGGGYGTGYRGGNGTNGIVYIKYLSKWKGLFEGGEMVELEGYVIHIFRSNGTLGKVMPNMTPKITSSKTLEQVFLPTSYINHQNNHFISPSPNPGFGGTPITITSIDHGTRKMNVDFFPTDVKFNIPGTPNTVSYSTSGTWIAPAGVISATVECIGAGGGGGVSNSPSRGGGGGAGGAWATKVVTVVPGQTYNITVGIGGNPASNNGGSGANGGDTIFGANLVVAKGGTGGSASNGGYSPSGNIGDNAYYGGSGGDGASDWPMAGGGGASGSYGATGGAGDDADAGGAGGTSVNGSGGDGGSDSYSGGGGSGYGCAGGGGVYGVGGAAGMGGVLKITYTTGEDGTEILSDWLIARSIGTEPSRTGQDQQYAVLANITRLGGTAAQLTWAASPAPRAITAWAAGTQLVYINIKRNWLFNNNSSAYRLAQITTTGHWTRTALIPGGFFYTEAGQVRLILNGYNSAPTAPNVARTIGLAMPTVANNFEGTWTMDSNPRITHLNKPSWADTGFVIDSVIKHPYDPLKYMGFGTAYDTVKKVGYVVFNETMSEVTTSSNYVIPIPTGYSGSYCPKVVKFGTMFHMFLCEPNVDSNPDNGTWTYGHYTATDPLDVNGWTRIGSIGIPSVDRNTKDNIRSSHITECCPFIYNDQLCLLIDGTARWNGSGHRGYRNYSLMKYVNSAWVNVPYTAFSSHQFANNIWSVPLGHPSASCVTIIDRKFYIAHAINNGAYRILISRKDIPL